MSFPSARTGRTPPPPRAYARGVAAGRPRQPRGIYATRAQTPPIAPRPQPAPPSLPPSTEPRRGGRVAHADLDEDVRSAVYPTMSEWCSMQQELVDRGVGLDGAVAEDDVFSDGHSEVMPLVCENTRRETIGAPRGYGGAPRRLRDLSCSGRVEGGLPPGTRGPDRQGWSSSGLPPSVRPATGGSGYYRGRGSSALRAGKIGGLEPRSSSVEPGAGMAAVRDVDVRAPGGVAKLKHMFETTRMSRIGGFGAPTKVHNMVQRYEGGSSPEQ